MILKEYCHDDSGFIWYCTDASWVPGCQAEDKWLLEAWERMHSAGLQVQIGPRRLRLQSWGDDPLVLVDMREYWS